MTAETAGEFNGRRAIEEKFLAEQATDSVQSIPHDQLSKLHADEAQASSSPPPAQEPALDIKAVDGSVVVVVAGEVTSLTPQAALRMSDRLSARARDADHQKPPI